MGRKCWLRCGNQAKGSKGLQVIIQQLDSSVVLVIRLLVGQMRNRSSFPCIGREFFFIHDMGYDNTECTLPV